MKKLASSIIFVISTATSSLAMTSSELANFASNYKYKENEPVIYSYYDGGCLSNIPVFLVQTINLNAKKIGGITAYFACWGATFTYFEMESGNLNSIRVVSEVGAGRSTQYSNWSPNYNPGEDLTSKQLKAVAQVLNKLAK